MRCFWFVIVLLFSIQVKGQNEACECYKYFNGTFYMEPSGSMDTLIIERDKYNQVEYEVGKKNKQVKLNVIWLDNCTYILRHPQIQPSQKKKFLNGDVLSKIIRTTDEYYIVSSKTKGGKTELFTIYTYPPSKP